MGKFFDDRFYKREERIERSYPITDDLFEYLCQASITYNASLSDLLNACIRELIEFENFYIYTWDWSAKIPKHNFQIDKSNIAGLNQLKRKTHFTVSALVNMSIQNIKNMD